MLRHFVVPLCLSFGLSGPGAAQISDLRCDDSQRLTQTLQNVMRAERSGMGLRDPDTMLEVWVESQSGDWIIVQRYSNGTSCIVAMGEHWESKVAGPA